MANSTWQDVYEYWLELVKGLDPNFQIRFTAFKSQASTRKLHGVFSNPFFVWACKDATCKEWRSLDLLARKIDEETFDPCDWQGSAGEQVTLKNLWTFRKNPELCAATLLAGSLFERLGSSRGSFPSETWPDVRAVKALYQLVMDELSRRKDFRSWHHFYTSALPYFGQDDDVIQPALETLDDLMSHLAKEHVELFFRYQPAVVFCRGGE